MSSLTRWDPIREATSLRDAMSQLFEQAVMRPGFGAFTGDVAGQMNVIESEGRYRCQVLLPGVNPDSIELTVRQNTLTLHTALPELLPEEQRKSATYLLREFGSGEITRTITFPKDVDGDKIQAQYDHGILTVQIPLAEHAQPKRIKVQQTEAPQSATVVEDHAIRPELTGVN